MNFGHEGKNQYDVSNNILQLVGACYVSPLPNAVSKSPGTKLNESTSSNWSFLKNVLQLSLRAKITFFIVKVG